MGVPAPLFESPSPERAARTCLSSRTFNVFIHNESEFHSRPVRRVTQGIPARGWLTRAAFSLVTSLLAAQEKVTNSRSATGELVRDSALFYVTFPHFKTPLPSAATISASASFCNRNFCATALAAAFLIAAT